MKLFIRSLGVILLGVAFTACSSTADKPPDLVADPGEGEPEGAGEGEGEPEGAGEGEGEPEGAGEGEGEPEGAGEGEGEPEGAGEGEGEERPDGGVDPDLGEWSGYRGLPLVCGSVPDAVVAPAPLVVTATVVLGGEWCSAILQAGVSPGPGGEQQLFLKAVPSPTGPFDCGDQPFHRSLSLAIPQLEVGEWAVAMRGADRILLRKTVHVLPEGSDPPPAGPNCLGERDGFVGTCGVDLFCDEPAVCRPEGHCESDLTPRLAAGSYPMTVQQSEGICLDPEQPALGYENTVVLARTVLVLELDPGDPSRGTVRFEGDELLPHFELAVTILGNTFHSTGAAQYVEHGELNCTRSYGLQLGGEQTASGLSVDLSLAHREFFCGRSEAALSCELSARLVEEREAPVP